MKLHTKLTADEIALALRHVQAEGLVALDVTMTVFIPHRSQTHPHSYEIQLGTHDQHSLPTGYTDQHGRRLRVRRARGGTAGAARWAATWHEWGWFIMSVFAGDPGARWGSDPARSRRPWGYFSPADFHAKTGNAFRLNRRWPGVTTQRLDGTTRPAALAEADAALRIISGQVTSAGY
jgi:hypothetical protein